MPFADADAALQVAVRQEVAQRLDPKQLKPGTYEISATVEARVNGLHANFAFHGRLKVGPRRGLKWQLTPQAQIDQALQALGRRP
jgi:hypothetical protein